MNKEPRGSSPCNTTNASQKEKVIVALGKRNPNNNRPNRESPKTEAYRDDFFTPPYAVRMFLDNLEKNIPNLFFALNKKLKALDPCVGEGHFVLAIQDFFPQWNIDATDIVDHGIGKVSSFNVCDFRDASKSISQKYDVIFSNPPFKNLNEWISWSYKNSKQFVIFFSCNNVLHSKKRFQFWHSESEKHVFIFTHRINMSRGKVARISNMTNNDYVITLVNKKKRTGLTYLHHISPENIDRFWKDGDETGLVRTQEPIKKNGGSLL